MEWVWDQKPSDSGRMVAGRGRFLQLVAVNSTVLPGTLLLTHPGLLRDLSDSAVANPPPKQCLFSLLAQPVTATQWVQCVMTVSR